MRCETCRFAPSSDAEGFADECGYFQDYGKVFADDSYGCTLTYSHLAKIERLHDQAMLQEANDFGIENDFNNHGWDIDKTINECKHMIGLDWAKPYMRHGKLFYKPYRNGWGDEEAKPEFDWLCDETYGFMHKRTTEDGYVFYHLTNKGLDWLGRRLGIQTRRAK